MFRTLFAAVCASPGARASTCLAVALVCSPALAFAQGPGGTGSSSSASSSMFSNLANPAIGANALFTGQAAPNLNEAYGLHFDEAELSLISVVDPYWTFNGNLVFTGKGPVDAEEVWVRNTSLPSLALRLGKLRGVFGKHGLLHNHAFPFVQAPIMMANTIGNEGFKAAGLEAAWLTPLPWYSELTGSAFEATNADDDHPLDLGSTKHDNIPLLGHFKNLFDVTDETTLDIGQSILQGHGADGLWHAAYGGDITFRNVPARNSNRHGWIAQGEYIQKGAYDHWSDYQREADGGYASFQYRVSQVWWVGIRGERARRSVADFVVDDAGDPLAATVDRGTMNVAWSPSEFSFIRLEYSHAKADAGIHPTDDRLLVQMSYTIGYHPAHAY